MIRFIPSLRRFIISFGVPALAATLRVSAAPDATSADPYAWLEDVGGAKPLAWVKEQDEATAKRLQALPDYAGLYQDALKVLDSESRIPAVEPHGKYLYNLWQDKVHPRGLYRRTTLEEFRKAEPVWETVIDVDALAKAEGKPWAFLGTTWRRPDELRCLVPLSPGGGDAVEEREFDLGTLAFVPGGFVVPVAKSRVSWRDNDSLYVATDFGPETQSAAGYPERVKLWHRGTPLSAAETLYTAAKASNGAGARRLHAAEGNIDLLSDGLTFFTSQEYQILEGKLVPLKISPKSQVAGNFKGRLVILTKEAWTIQGKTFPVGSVVIADMSALRGEAGAIDLVAAPSADNVISNVQVLTDGLLVESLKNVSGHLARYVPSPSGWTAQDIAMPEHGALTVASTNDDTGDAWVQFESFTTPPALYLVAAGQTGAEPVKSQAPTFDGSKFEVSQLWATSADGTQIPYFVVAAKGMKHDGKNPVWMFSYGGFEIALTPAYSGSYEDLHGAYGKLWLERGGVFVLANIRGGGEFGPKWHEATLKATHYKAFEDFEAVAKDIVARKITSPAHLGIEGRSNGGLLVSATMVRHPELYGAVVCGNPLIDMKRYSHLLAGASWIAEYGDPDQPDQWAYISQYSPYQNVKAGVKMPPVLFYTTTRDDRVHPGHARKMAAKMEDFGDTVEYAENTEGGHHGSVTHAQLATRLASTYSFLWEYLR